MPDKSHRPTDQPPADQGLTTATEFVWPPPEDDPSIEVVEFGADSAPFARGGALAPAPVTSASPTLQGSPRDPGLATADRRKATPLERRRDDFAQPLDAPAAWAGPLDPELSQRIAAGPEPPFEDQLRASLADRPARTPSLRSPPRPSSPTPPSVRRRSRALPLALAGLVALAAAEGVYILRSPGTAPPPSAATPSGPETPAVGTLVISSHQPGVRVAIDGRDAGATPLTLADLPAGTHTVSMSARGQQFEQTVTLEAGTSLAISMPRLVASGAPAASAAERAAAKPRPTTGTVMVSSPLAMDIHEGDTLVGRSGRATALTPGSHTLTLFDAASGYSLVQTVQVAAGGTVRLEIAVPERPVNINATPWATVLVDGSAVGETPIGNLMLPVGPHTFTFRHDTLPERTVRAVVRADQPNRVAADLRR